jgi:hypothetical protein
MTDAGNDERQQKEIECIEGPAEKTGYESVALIAVQNFEKPDRFHV